MSKSSRHSGWGRRSAGRPGRPSLVVAVLACCLAVLVWPAVAPAAGGWSAPGVVAEADILSQSSAVAPSGEVIDSWIRNDGKNYRVEVSARPAGGNFSLPAQLSEAGGSAEQPNVAFDSQGDAIVVWARDGLIEYDYRTAGGAFGKSQLLSEVPGSGSPRVVFASNGEAVVVWLSVTGELGGPLTYDLEAAELAAGGHSFGPAQVVDRIGPVSITESMYQIFVGRPVADGHGDVLFPWEPLEEHKEFSGTTMAESVRVASRPAGGVFSAPVTLAKAVTSALAIERLEGFSAAIDPNGDALVVWSRRDEKTEVQQVEGSYRPAGGTFESSPEIVSGSRKESREARAALAPDGSATVVWVGIDIVSEKHAVMEADRPPGGSFSAPQLISDPTTEPGTPAPEQPAIAVAPSGEATTVWVRYQEPSRVEASVRPAGGTFGAGQAISPGGKASAAQLPQLGLDGAGDAVATWIASFAGEWAVHDVAGPALQGLSIPTTATVGSPVGFAVSPLDAFSPLGSTTWSFGDGATGTGTSLTHAYAHPGTFTVGLTSSDLLGNVTAASSSIKVVAPGSSAPRLTAVKESNKTWRRGSKAAHLSRRVPVGTIFSFVLDQAGRVTVSFTQPAKGRRVGHACVAPNRHNKRRHACTRTLTRGSLSFAAHAGSNRISFQGRTAAKHLLSPGRYTAVILAKNSAGLSSTAVRLTFTIVR